MASNPTPEKDRMRNAIITITLLIITVIAVQANAQDITQVNASYYETELSREIAVCIHQSVLLSSRSQCLVQKGSREASKAYFLTTHRHELISAMKTLPLETKRYKIDLFLNHQFSHSDNRIARGPYLRQSDFTDGSLISSVSQ